MGAHLYFHFLISGPKHYNVIGTHKNHINVNDIVP